MRRFAVITLAMGVLLAGSAPTGAAPPEDPPGPVIRFTDHFNVSFEDTADGLVALSVEPGAGCYGEGFEDNLAEFQIVELPDGSRQVLIRDDDMPMELYAASSHDEICEGFDDGPPYPEPIATGTVRVVFTRNARTEADPQETYGYSATGTLERADGTACAFSATVRVLVTKEFEYRVTQNIHSNC